jgi:hypothetical protein
MSDLNTCAKCGAEFYYDPKSHKCKGQWESECAAAGVAPVARLPLTSWVEECMTKQREEAHA